LSGRRDLKPLPYSRNHRFVNVKARRPQRGDSLVEIQQSRIVSLGENAQSSDGNDTDSSGHAAGLGVIGEKGISVNLDGKRQGSRFAGI
jgi:hypothetical protein